MKYHELAKILKKHGCYKYKNGTRHEVWYSPLNCRKFEVWRHKDKDIPTGTAHSIMKEAGIR